ncbi:murein hydrolase activator EnvC family protein [Nesterenkonia aurantiaca]|uniref:murein hydrolase activator EnvC family protein n=1 Tax=Nesterenkonia aurantiaca TaxID=1436010 RepID=UPI003EE59429
MGAGGRGITGAKVTALGVVLLLGLGGLPTATPEDSSSAPARALWQLPVVADELRPFARPPAPWGAGHRGVDLGPLETSARIRAPAEGEISFAGVVVDRPVLSIRHGNGYLSSFEPVETALEVGDRVSAGDPVGILTTGAGHCEAPCVHWGVRLDGEYINPLLLTGDAEPSVLLPLSGD